MPFNEASRRRVPRRTFESQVGVLAHGLCARERSYQVGEGGMMISSASELEIGRQLVVTFFLPSRVSIIVRGIVRNKMPAKDGMPLRYGIEFVNLEFQFKRELRNFVALASNKDEF